MKGNGMRTVGELLADPSSNLSRNMAKAQATMKANEQVVAQWMAKGYTREQAWAKALA